MAGRAQPTARAVTRAQPRPSIHRQEARKLYVFMFIFLEDKPLPRLFEGGEKARQNKHSVWPRGDSRAAV
jgi:hypothetical protein